MWSRTKEMTTEQVLWQVARKVLNTIHCSYVQVSLL